MWQDRGPIALGESKDPKKKKDFWTDQISTGGGVAGALGGAATGAAIGSVVPGIGTIIGGLIGGVAGGALGSGGGELAENAITGEKDIWQNVGKEALLGGVFSAPPLRAGKAIIGAGKALATGAGGQAAKTAAEAALTKPGLISQALGKGGKALGGLTDDLAVKQFRLSPSQTANFKKKFGEDAGKVINRYGFSSVDDIATKGVGPLQEQFGQLTRNIGQVSRDDVASAFNKKIDALRKSAVQDNQIIAKQLESQRDSVLQQFGQSGVLDGVSLNSLRGEFDKLVNYTQQAANPARYDVNKRSADAIREVLQGSDPTGTLKNVGKEISKLRQLQDVAMRQDELGRGSLPANMTGLLGAGVAGGLTADPIMAAGGFAATKAINSEAGRKALNQGVEGLSGRLTSMGNAPVNPMGIVPTIGRQVAGRAVFGGGAQEPAPSSLEDTLMGQSSLGISNPMTTSSAQSASVPITDSMGQSYTQSQDMATQNPYGQANLMYDMQRDPANAEKYIAYYQMLQDVFAGPEQKPLSQSNQSALASADNADNTLSQLESLYSAAGGGSGRVGGFFQNVAGQAGFDKNASVYNSLSQASVTQIAKALAGAGGGTVSDMDAKVIIAAMPTLQDSPEEAAVKFNALRQRLQNARDNTMFYGQGGATPNSLEQALMQQGAY